MDNSITFSKDNFQSYHLLITHVSFGGPYMTTSIVIYHSNMGIQSRRVIMCGPIYTIHWSINTLKFHKLNGGEFTEIVEQVGKIPSVLYKYTSRFHEACWIHASNNKRHLSNFRMLIVNNKYLQTIHTSSICTWPSCPRFSHLQIGCEECKVHVFKLLNISIEVLRFEY